MVPTYRSPPNCPRHPLHSIGMGGCPECSMEEQAAIVRAATEKLKLQKDYKEYMEGVEVSEEYVANDLGFKDIYDFRRWKTEQGHKVAELEYALEKANREAKRFQWHVKRMHAVLEKIEQYFVQECGFSNTDELCLLRAVQLVLGRPDWGGKWREELKDWLKDIE